MTRLLALTLPLVALVGAVKRLDLTATDGEAAGKYAFDGGEEEATCKACKAVMEHVSRRLAEPMYDEKGYFAGRKTRVAGSREEQATKLNQAARVQAVLDPTTCQAEMKKYDLGYVGGENQFIYKDPEKPANYPIHMELNEWAKHELATFCETLFEEKEDELVAAVQAADSEGAKSLSDTICKVELDLCKPPPPPAPPAPPKPLSKAEKLEKADEIFKSMDADSNGFIDKHEVQMHLKAMQREHGSQGKKIKDEVASFFRTCDDDNDGKVIFEEYKNMWFKKKKKKEKKGAAADEKAFFDTVLDELSALRAALMGLVESARSYAQQSPYVALSGVGAMSAAVYVGGMVVRVW